MKNNIGPKILKYCFLVIRGIVKLVYPKIVVVGEENLPKEAGIVVGNHTQMNGPICGELYFPGRRKMWCASQMMHIKKVPKYAFEDFWSRKPKFMHPFYRLLSYIIAPLSVCVFNSARTIAVYHDLRLRSTFRDTISEIENGASVIIFPECYEPYNNIVNNFQDKFVDVARAYYKKNGVALSFTPLYIAPKLKSMHIGKPIWFCPENSIEEERSRICGYLKDEITRIAKELPVHKVVPYENVPSKYYRYNISVEDEE